jgi:thiamine-phosphate pyrophosphorylase
MNKQISPLHYITQDLPGKSHPELVRNACMAGVVWVQLRIKNKPYDEWLNIAEQVVSVCRNYNVRLIINDNVSIAGAIKADGVHLGKTDMSPLDARKKLGDNVIIGGTANTFEDIKILASAGVDYIGLGPYRFTTTKENLSPLLGLERYKSITEQCRKNGITIPIIAIGGIKIEDVNLLMESGVYGIAVSSAINKSTTITETVKQFQKSINFIKASA